MILSDIIAANELPPLPNCLLAAAAATRYHHISDARAQRGPSRTAAPRRAQLLSLPRDYVLFTLFTSLSRPTVPNCDLILFFCLLLAGISDFNYGP